jgi:hypothetical protein
MGFSGDYFVWKFEIHPTNMRYVLYIYKYAFKYIYDIKASLGPNFALISLIFGQLVENTSDYLVIQKKTFIPHGNVAAKLHQKNNGSIPMYIHTYNTCIQGCVIMLLQPESRLSLGEKCGFNMSSVSSSILI